MPKISVIIPVYNTEKYLRYCLDSVLNQTFQDIEVLCIDDGSTDTSADILREYAQMDNRVNFIHQKNKGLSAARNVGIENISGEYCYFLDSDDYINNNLFEYAMKIFDNFDIDFFCFGSKVFCEDGYESKEFEALDRYVKVKRDGIFDINFDICMNTNIHIWNKIIKTSKIRSNNIKFIDKLLYEDIYFMWLYYFNSSRAYFETEIFHNYRLRPNSIMALTAYNKTYDTGIHHLYNWHEILVYVSKNRELFINKYEYLPLLLEVYRNRTKEMIPIGDKYKVELLYCQYKQELESINKNFMEEDNNIRAKLYDNELLANDKSPEQSSYKNLNLLKKIFSIKNSGIYKVVTILGIQYKYKSKKLVEREKYRKIDKKLDKIREDIQYIKSLIR